MLDSINFNTLSNTVIYTLDTLLASKKYPESLLNYLYLITLGMILNYGDEFIEDIYNTILFTNFTFENNNKYQIKEKNNLYYKEPLNNNYLKKWFDLSTNLPTVKINNNLLFKIIGGSNIKTLEYLTSELNYILFNKHKKYSLKNIFKIKFDYFKNGLTEKKNQKYSETIDKIFSTLQAEDIIKTIIKLKNYNIKNKKLKNALNMFPNIDINNYRIEGLDLLVNLFRPLYEIKEIKQLINKNILLENNIIEKEFDKILGKNTYKNICNKLNYLNQLYEKNKEGLYNNYFNFSLEYVFIRNEFINKYLNKKYLLGQI